MVNNKDSHKECGCQNHGHECCHNDEHKHNHHESECCHGHEHHHGHSHTHACGCEGEEQDVRKIIAGVVVFLIAVILPYDRLFTSVSAETLENVKLIIFLLIYYVTAGDIVKNAMHNLAKGKALDEQFLMTVASIGAFFVGEYSEGVAVMLFYMVGEAFQDYAVDKSRKSITDLMDIRPDYANLYIDDSEVRKVSPKEVKTGDVIVVKPGEKVPLDGVVISGSALLDTSALTGESIPVEAVEGSQAISGSININGVIHIKTQKEFGESTVSKILELVQNASGKKAQTEKFISRFAKVYTPIVVALAAALAVLPPIITAFFMGENISDVAMWSKWIYRALTFLVISCPCALVISVPLSFFAGIGAASKKGILVKGSNYLEAMANCDTVIFDKTGTLTKGKFHIEKIITAMDEVEFLKSAVVAEVHSNHPIAVSLKEYLKKKNAEAFNEIERAQSDISIEEIAGKGIKAEYKEDIFLAGNAKLLQDAGIDINSAEDVGTVVYVAKNGVFLGYAVIADQIKENAKTSMEKLRKCGVKDIIMLTGDRREVADRVAADLGIDTVYSELLPTDKVSHVEEILAAQHNDTKTAFVGDGINDAPVLARVDIGIAMGAMGSDAAIEAADIVLMDDEPMAIVKAIEIARRTIAIAKQNIVFALGIKILILILAALGYASMWAAVFADVGVAFMAILNAMRAMKVK